VLAYIEYISRRPGIALEGFHHTVNRGQTGWEGDYADDELILNVGRTWRLGPEPEYFAVWYLPSAGLERLGDWERIFRTGEIASLEEPFRVVARIDRAGCYHPLLEPVVGKGGPYYAEFFDVTAGSSSDEVRSYYRERGEESGFVLNVLLDRVGRLGPDPRGLAVWSLPSYAELEGIAIEAADDGPVRILDAGVYVDLGHEIL
jgi:hypothetical protein